jgi:hypothetical protein
VQPDDTDDQAVEPDSPDQDIDAMVARRDAAYAALDTSIVIMSAEQPVMLSWINDLATETDRARQRLADAHEHLAAVEQHADPDIIAAARCKIHAHRDELDRIALANTNEAAALMNQGLANLEVAMANRRIADAAHQAFLDAINPQTTDSDPT